MIYDIKQPGGLPSRRGLYRTSQNPGTPLSTTYFVSQQNVTLGVSGLRCPLFSFITDSTQAKDKPPDTERQTQRGKPEYKTAARCRPVPERHPRARHNKKDQHQ
ncbi:hypothetical protein ACM917_003902 [Cronobacter sakazakii]